jgi:hypothetical protein
VVLPGEQVVTLAQIIHGEFRFFDTRDELNAWIEHLRCDCQEKEPALKVVPFKLH